MDAGKLFRIQTIRILAFLMICSNLVITTLVLPVHFSNKDLSESTLSNLAWAYEEKAKNGRVICVLVYEEYRASNLVITKEAYDYLGLEERIYQHYCRVNNLVIVPDDTALNDLSSWAVAKEVQFGDPEAFRSARLLATDIAVETVYAILREDVIHFVPVSARVSS